MRTNKIGAALVVLAICIAVPAAARDDYDDEYDNTELLFNDPSLCPTLAGLFTGSIDAVNARTVSLEMHHALSARLNFDFTKGLLNALVATPIPIYRSEAINFAIPLFGALITSGSGYKDYEFNGETDSREIGYDGYMLGGGLMYYGKYGLLAAYVGYSWESGREYDYEWSENKWRWSISPVINAKKIPLLNSIIRLINGFYSLDNLKMNRGEFKPTYKANGLFRPIILADGFMTFVLSAYTKKDWYNADAKYNLHGGKLGIILGNDDGFSFMLGADAGYREFFDVLPSSQAYENGLYTKIDLVLMVARSLGISFFAESGSTPHFKDPAFGFAVSIGFNTGGTALSLNNFHKFSKSEDPTRPGWAFGLNSDMYFRNWDEY